MEQLQSDNLFSALIGISLIFFGIILYKISKRNKKPIRVGDNNEVYAVKEKKIIRERTKKED